MTKTFAALAALLFLPLGAMAQTPPPVGVPITLETARKVIAAAEAEARRNDWQMAIAVVDAEGKLVAFERMDNAQAGSGNIAMSKAAIANPAGRSGAPLQNAVASAVTGLRFLTVSGSMPADGGIPIVVNGEVVGAIGVAGEAADREEICAKAGAAAVK